MVNGFLQTRRNVQPVTGRASPHATQVLLPAYKASKIDILFLQRATTTSDEQDARKGPSSEGSESRQRIQRALANSAFHHLKATGETSSKLQPTAIERTESLSSEDVTAQSYSSVGCPSPTNSSLDRPSSSPVKNSRPWYYSPRLYADCSEHDSMGETLHL